MTALLEVVKDSKDMGEVVNRILKDIKEGNVLRNGTSQMISYYKGSFLYKSEFSGRRYRMDEVEFRNWLTYLIESGESLTFYEVVKERK